MKKDDFKWLKNQVIKSKFTGDIMCHGYLFINATEKQAEELKRLALQYAETITFLPDGRFKVGAYIFK